MDQHAELDDADGRARGAQRDGPEGGHGVQRGETSGQRAELGGRAGGAYLHREHGNMLDGQIRRYGDLRGGYFRRNSTPELKRHRPNVEDPMLVAIPLAAAVTLFAYSGQAVPADAGASAVAAQNRTLANDRGVAPTAASVYEGLVSMPHKERVEAFREQPSAMKAAVWRHHLTKALAEHPQFSVEQRLVIEDFISILTAELYERYDLTARDAALKAAVQAPIEEIRRRARAAFPRDLYVGIFLDLQARDRTKARQVTATSTKLQESPTNAIGYCNCNRNFDDCFFWEGSGSYCDSGCYWTTSYGCGPGFLLRCDGFCTPPDPPT